jgi:hypothetical protein
VEELTSAQKFILLILLFVKSRNKIVYQYKEWWIQGAITAKAIPVKRNLDLAFWCVHTSDTAVIFTFKTEVNRISLKLKHKNGYHNKSGGNRFLLNNNLIWYSILKSVSPVVLLVQTLLLSCLLTLFPT